MPVKYVKNLGEDTFLIMWEITESESDMKIMLHERLNDWDAKATHYENKHWLASRLALLSHFRNEEVDLVKDAFNKPHLYVDHETHFISITHSFNYAAVMISSKKKVALDIELIDQRVERVMKKFCNASELEWVAQAPNKTEILTTIWSAKETLYKWYGLKELDFREHLFISPIKNHNESIKVKGEIKKGDTHFSCFIEVERMENFILTRYC